jgi:hypothetical protein
MGRSILLQDWITVAATEDGPITQDESEWLETGTFTDAIFYTSTAGVAGTPRLIFESSPSEDPDGFEVVEKISLSPSTNYTTAVIFDVVSDALLAILRDVEGNQKWPAGNLWDEI